MVVVIWGLIPVLIALLYLTHKSVEAYLEGSIQKHKTRVHAQHAKRGIACYSSRVYLCNSLVKRYIVYDTPQAIYLTLTFFNLMETEPHCGLSRSAASFLIARFLNIFQFSMEMDFQQF